MNFHSRTIQLIFQKNKPILNLGGSMQMKIDFPTINENELNSKVEAISDWHILY